MSKLISYNSITTSYVCLALTGFFILLLGFSIYVNVMLFVIISSLAICYLLSVALMNELRVDGDRIIVKHVLKKQKVFFKQDFVSIDDPTIIPGILTIKFQSGNWYLFIPSIKAGFSDFSPVNRINQYLSFWNKELREKAG